MAKRRTLPNRLPQPAAQPAPEAIPEAPQASENRGGFLRRALYHEVALLSGLVLLFGIYYLWTASPCSSWHEDCSPNQMPTRSGELIGPYNALADSFLTGQLSLLVRPDSRLLQLSDPYDPWQNWRYRLHDMSLYGGNYYMPFGPVPALILFAPFRVLTGAYLPDAFGCALLALGAYAVTCLTLRLFLKKFFPALSAWVFPLLCFGLGFCNTYPYLLRRPAVYETAIASGQLFLMLTVLLLGRVILGSSHRPLWDAAGAGTMAALAFASRPPLLIPVCGLFLILPIAPGLPARNRRELLVWTLVPFVAGGLLVACYNYARFHSPFEFGYYHQLAGMRTDFVSFFQPSGIPAGLYLYFLCPPTLSSSFPYILVAPHAPFTLPRNYAFRIEPVTGIFWLSPLLLLLFTPWFWKPASADGPPVIATLKIWMAVWIGSAVTMLCLAGSVSSTMRYESDVSNLLFMAASLVIAWLFVSGPPRARALAPGILLVTISWGVVLNAAIGITGYYDVFKRIDPAQYHAIESFFRPVARLLAALGVQP